MKLTLLGNLRQYNDLSEREKWAKLFAALEERKRALLTSSEAEEGQQAPALARIHQDSNQHAIEAGE